MGPASRRYHLGGVGNYYLELGDRRVVSDGGKEFDRDKTIEEAVRGLRGLADGQGIGARKGVARHLAARDRNRRVADVEAGDVDLQRRAGAGELVALPVRQGGGGQGQKACQTESSFEVPPEDQEISLLKMRENGQNVRKIVGALAFPRCRILRPGAFTSQTPPRIVR